MMPKITDVIMTGAEELHVFDSPMLLTREYSLTMEQRFIKRMIDIVCSLILIVLASPIMLITAILIKLGDRGPVLYKQVRCTIGQKEFKILKFRSMRTDAEKDGQARLAQKNDDRITPIGKFIRACRIDELPQLFNILKGDMSFIGPRPLLVKYLPLYTPEQMRRHEVRPGISGWAQVNGRNTITFTKQFEYDVYYVDHLTFWLDVKIFFMTILKVLKREGISEEGQATREQFNGKN
jgi:exopolysaccharide biosynthesis polyprenyl glycosylphosphotransferase